MAKTGSEPAGRRITPVLLSGGAGTRLWPLSRRLLPKQLLPLTGDKALFRMTVDRVSGQERFAPPLVICNEEHRFLIAEQLREADVEPGAIVLEPVARDTAPAVAAGALIAAEQDPDALILILPSDHVIADVAGFHAAIDLAAEAARLGRIVTFGIAANSPETCYGYVQSGDPLDGAPGVRTVARFAEKPDETTAKAFLESGDYFWNGGIFLFAAKSLVAELERQAPDLLDAVRAAIAQGARDLDFFRLDADAFSASPRISFDYAVMEKAEHVAVVPVEMGWSDVGSWSALLDISDRDAEGNRLIGDVMSLDVSNCYIRSDDRLVAAIGVKDLVVVSTADALLVADKARVQDVKAIVADLQAAGREEADVHPRVYRPWGWYQTIDDGERFKVKRLMVRPGHKLSLQMHRHRAEHWVVVKGTATVTRDDERILLQENESSFIPIGTRHRLENEGKIDLHLIEVQSGAYLEEDDIVRFEDTYNRG